MKCLIVFQKIRARGIKKISIERGIKKTNYSLFEFSFEKGLLSRESRKGEGLHGSNFQWM